MRTNHLPEAVKIIISAIDEKINEYRNLIIDLENEKNRYINNQQTDELGKARKTVILQKIASDKSKKNRIIDAINRTQGKFDTEQLLTLVNNDGGPEITKENFAPTFSNLKNDYYKKVADKDGRGLYEKVE